ncbi:inositol hexakisphosphate and diphosphoinositol-pentakisphosphate kinase [Paecilomyces lecythidis]
MLLVYQAGSVHVGEVARYTLTYTPAADPILPTPSELHIRIKNTSALPLRAAYLHGPYTLYAACYPSSFNPDHKHDLEDGPPQFEPNLRAGGSWDAVIPIPERLRQTPETALSIDPEISAGSVTWVIEITSQVIFSTTASVHFELLVGRDEKSLNLGSGSRSGGSGNVPPPVQLQDHWKPGSKHHQSAVNTRKGVNSKSITLVVDDTSSLWNTPAFPSWEEKQHLGKEAVTCQTPQETQGDEHATGDNSNHDGGERKRKKRRIHFVVLTHGLHSNLGADMLYLKESIDASSKAARKQAKEERDRRKHEEPGRMAGEDDAESDDEQVIVRGFPGNAVRTERGIQYLGKRLAKYVLLMTYPDQPYLPTKKPKKSLSRSLTGLKSGTGSTGQNPLSEPSELGDKNTPDYAYEITSISFIGHSLGGLVQTYAIAYIQKHSPQFFDRIKPINFIALATPFLGLSNENPVYVKFALDFGLVGRTGQDLGLSWTAPKVRSGWGAVIGGLGNESKKAERQSNPEAKPLLRILPSGPAHQVLLKFRNRTVYSNVVNDGIVPLRTSCLLFLDWRGLDRVEKARRENGLVGTMAEWGWAELTGANSNPVKTARTLTDLSLGPAAESQHSSSQKEPVAATGKAKEESSDGDGTSSPAPHQFLKRSIQTDNPEVVKLKEHSHSTPATPATPTSPLGNFLSMLRPKQSKDSTSSKDVRIYKRSQTMNISSEHTDTSSSDVPQAEEPRPGLVRGDSLYEEDSVHAPPKTTFFESAGDLLKPPLPTTDFLIDPAARPRTIFHDRVYHPEDIPPPSPVKRRTIFSSSHSARPGSNSESSQALDHHDRHQTEGSMSGMKVEEKIARAYHRDLSWRKVLVRLEPDAHNNIIVRRMFANAYGWPVVKHLVDTHFAYSIAAETNDVLEPSVERAKPVNEAASNSGEEVEGQTKVPSLETLEQNESALGDGGTHPPELQDTVFSEHPQKMAPVPDPAIGRADVHVKNSKPLPNLPRQPSDRWSDQLSGDDNVSLSEAESSDGSYHDNLNHYRQRTV